MMNGHVQEGQGRASLGMRGVIEETKTIHWMRISRPAIWSEERRVGAVWVLDLLPSLCCRKQVGLKCSTPWRMLQMIGQGLQDESPKRCSEVSYLQWMMQT